MPAGFARWDEDDRRADRDQLGDPEPVDPAVEAAVEPNPSDDG
jgi:hypothetical protein